MSHVSITPVDLSQSLVSRPALSHFMLTSITDEVTKSRAKALLSRDENKAIIRNFIIDLVEKTKHSKDRETNLEMLHNLLVEVKWCLENGINYERDPQIPHATETLICSLDGVLQEEYPVTAGKVINLCIAGYDMEFDERTITTTGLELSNNRTKESCLLYGEMALTAFCAGQLHNPGFLQVVLDRLTAPSLLEDETKQDRIHRTNIAYKLAHEILQREDFSFNQTKCPDRMSWVVVSLSRIDKQIPHAIDLLSGLLLQSHHPVNIEAPQLLLANIPERKIRLDDDSAANLVLVMRKLLDGGYHRLDPSEKIRTPLLEESINQCKTYLRQSGYEEYLRNCGLD